MIIGSASQFFPNMSFILFKNRYTQKLGLALIMISKANNFRSVSYIQIERFDQYCERMWEQDYIYFHFPLIESWMFTFEMGHPYY